MKMEVNRSEELQEIKRSLMGQKKNHKIKILAWLPDLKGEKNIRKAENRKNQFKPEAKRFHLITISQEQKCFQIKKTQAVNIQPAVQR